MNTTMNGNMKIETIHPSPIAYVRQTGAYGKENIRAMEQLKKWARDSGLMNGKTEIFGIPQDNPQTTAPENCRYDACIALAKEHPPETEAVYDKQVRAGDTMLSEQVSTSEAVYDKQVPAGGNVQYGELSGGAYAVFTVSHTAEAVAQAWIEIFPLLSASGYLPDVARPILERYQAELVAAHLCEICVPIDSSEIVS